MRPPDWHVDQDAVRYYARGLGLSMPLVIAVTDQLPPTTRGDYACPCSCLSPTCDHPRDRHTIRLSNRQRTSKANSSLWHELAHLHQFERMDNRMAYHLDHVDQFDYYHYRDRPCEIEARDFEAVHNDIQIVEQGPGPLRCWIDP